MLNFQGGDFLRESQKMNVGTCLAETARASLGDAGTT